MEHAFQTAVSLGKVEEAQMWNRELISYLVRLTDAIRDTAADNRPNNGEL
jgi:hypothetical protein